MPDLPVRVVIDTNVVLDLFVFNDPATAPLAAALHAGRAHWLYSAEALAELERVLGYPEFALDAAAAARVLAGFHRLARLHAPVAHDFGPLPACRDPDDQKFLELAFAGDADLLVTRDRALLVMAKRIARLRAGLRIVTPAAAAALFTGLAAADGVESGAAAAPAC